MLCWCAWAGAVRGVSVSHSPSGSSQHRPGACRKMPPHRPCPCQSALKPPGERVPAEPAVLAEREPKALGFGDTAQHRLQGTRHAAGQAPAFSGGAAGAVGCLWPAPAGRPCRCRCLERNEIKEVPGACGLAIGAGKRRAKRDQRTWGCGQSEPGGGWGQLWARRVGSCARRSGDGFQIGEGTFLEADSCSLTARLGC